MKVLVIEDNEMVLKTIEFKLTKDGYQVTSARDGKEAMDKLSKSVFNLIVTDLSLPYVTGMEIIAHVKKNTPEVPVIVLSGADQEGTIIQAFTLGADDFISKPFNPAELSLRVKKLLIRSTPA